MGLRGPIPKQKNNAISFNPGVPSPPKYLDAEAKKEYRRIVKELESSGADLQQPDMAMVSLYAQSYADVARLTEVIREEGEVIDGLHAKVFNPRIRALEAAKKSMSAACAKLGFSPVDRARVPASKTKQGRKNDFENF